MRLPFFNKSEPQEPVAFEDSLIEDPERQKARHRLIGAAFLVAVGFIGLPLIFDSKPKQHNNDVAIQIIQPGIKSEEDKSVKEEAKELANEVKETPKEAPKEAKDAKKDIPPVAKTLDKGEEMLSVPETKPTKVTAGKFILQIGAFSSEERVKNWQAKLTEQKVSSYVENKTNKEGVKLFMLRSGPYADRTAAEAAEKKVKRVGLTPRVIEQKTE